MPNYNFLNEKPLQDWERIIGKITNGFIKQFGFNEIDDLNQEAWIVLYRAAEKYQPNKKTQFSTYAITCIRRHLFKYLTKKKRQVEIGEGFDIIDNHIDDDHLRQELMDLMNAEPLLKAYFSEGKTYEQIAKDTNCSPGTAYKNVKQAVQRAKEQLENH